MPPSTTSPKKVITTVILAVLLVVSLFFAFWAFSGRQDYKNNVDAKISTAVTQAKADQAAADKKQYDDLLKQPFKTFTGPATYGTVTFSYPKTWSAYNDQSDQSEPLNAYFYPGEVPGVQSDTAYPLRVELVNTSYDQVVQQFSEQITQGDLTSVAYIPPKMKGVANAQPGVKLDGQIGQNSSGDPVKGSMVILKVRDKTLQIYSQTSENLSDFNNTILPSLTFVP